MNLTIVYSTSRKNPEFKWFLDSLASQVRDTCVDVILVDLFCDEPRCMESGHPNIHIFHTPPKPTVWQGKHRITKDDWWAASNARNTGICLCQTKLIAFIDDRCVLGPRWLESAIHSHVGGYAVFGSYEKRIEMINGNPDTGVVIGEDHRDNGRGPVKCSGQWLFTCSIAMPLEWLLQINGFEELCDSLSGEDSILGRMMDNRAFPMRFDNRMKMIEDRTGTVFSVKRTDKGVSPNDKSHAALARFGRLNRTEHPWDLREIRDHVLAGGDWPSVDEFPKTDWYDGQPISEFK